MRTELVWEGDCHKCGCDFKVRTKVFFDTYNDDTKDFKRMLRKVMEKKGWIEVRTSKVAWWICGTCKELINIR